MASDPDDTQVSEEARMFVVFVTKRKPVGGPLACAFPCQLVTSVHHSGFVSPFPVCQSPSSLRSTRQSLSDAGSGRRGRAGQLAAWQSGTACSVAERNSSQRGRAGQLAAWQSGTACSVAERNSSQRGRAEQLAAWQSGTACSMAERNSLQRGRAEQLAAWLSGTACSAFRVVFALLNHRIPVQLHPDLSPRNGSGDQRQ
ncbi:hypothetical protein LSAT2_020883 [Lamellibrachia satsuma]|nr:hypothetical protein LSAT2_020883 [Lamellibrachia satsuma]